MGKGECGGGGAVVGTGLGDGGSSSGGLRGEGVS